MRQIDGASAAAADSHPRLESLAEWRADTIIHVIGVMAGLAACIALGIVTLPASSSAVVVSLVIYGAGLLAMLSCSAVYNITGEGRVKALWRRFDHAAIFVMIAGTYTPFLVIAIGGAWGTGLLIFVWAVATAGVVLKLLQPDRFEALLLAAYLLLGWTILVVIDRLITALSVPALLLLATGGILYCVGVLFHLWRRLPYHRAIWHGFVLVAAGCQYVAVLHVIPG